MLITEPCFAAAMEAIESHKRLNVDVETTGVDTWHGDKICGIAIRPPGLKQPAAYFPFRHETGPNLSDHRRKQIIKRLSRPGTIITNWNTKFDVHMLMNEGMAEPELAEDVMLAAHLMNENEDNFKLKDIATKYLGDKAKQQAVDLRDLLADRGLGKGDLWRLPASEVAPYACQDVRLVDRLRRFYTPELKTWKLSELWNQNNHYMMATIAMERRGMLLDLELVQQYEAEVSVEMEWREQRAAELAGYPINLNSSPQVQTWLKMKSTAREELEIILETEEVEAVRLLHDYRFYQRANSNYYTNYLQRVVQAILRCDLSHIGTVTGRLSCHDPNLQAVPRKTAIYKVKDVFISRPGYWLVSADYSQAELRLGSWKAQEKRMMEILNNGGDIHQATSDFLHIPRDAAKRMNFGAFYGLGVRACAKKLRCSVSIAASFLNTYHGGFPNIRPLYSFMQGLAEEHGYIRLWSGRIRHFNTPHTYTNKALSNYVQGGVGEVMRTKITEMYESFDFDIHMLLQVHDQVLFEVPEGDFSALRLISDTMTFHGFEGMPMPVDITYGKSWGDMKKWTPRIKLRRGRTHGN